MTEHPDLGLNKACAAAALSPAAREVHRWVRPVDEEVVR